MESSFTSVNGRIYTPTSSVAANVAATNLGCSIFDTEYTHSYKFEFPLGPYRLPYEISVAVDEMNITSKQQVGGLPLYPYRAPPIVLPQVFSDSQVYLTSKDTRTGDAKAFSVVVRSGYNNYAGPYLYSYAAATSFNLTLPAGIYSFQASAEGYKHFNTDLSVNGGESYYKRLLFTPDSFEDNELRVLLSWDQAIDIDLRVNFVLDSEYTCDISFSNPECGGAVQNPGGQEITINPVGAYRYLFYAKQTINDTNPITHSGLKVDVYIGNWKSPVVSLAGAREYEWSESTLENYRIWLGFCLDGIQGIGSLLALQSYVSVTDTLAMADLCDQVYGTIGEVYEPDYKATLKVDSPLPIIPDYFLPK